MIFGKKNPCETMLEGPTRQGARPGPTWPPRKAVGALLSPQESQYPDKNRVQISAQSKLRISGNLRNDERAESGSAETEGTRERDPISEGLSPLRRHGGHGPEGELSYHLGGGHGRIRRRGLSLSPPSRWRRNAAKARIMTAIYINNLATINTDFPPPICSGVTLFLPAVIST